MKITLKSGEVVEGTVAEIEELVKRLNEQITVASVEGEIEKFKIGDYVRLSIKDGEHPHFGWGGVKNGEIGVVEGIYSDKIVVNFPSFEMWNAKPDELVKLSPREVAFARAGRKLDEFKKGDIARVLHSPCASPEGTLVEVVKIIDHMPSIRAKGWSVLHKDIFEYSYDPKRLELVAPVEHRVDTEASD